MAVADFLNQSGARGRDALRATKAGTEKVELTEDQQQSLTRTAGRAALGGMSAVANLLDLPGSMLRDVLTLNNPLDQVLSPFSDDNRTSGEDLLQKWGLQDSRPSRSKAQGFGRFVANVGTEIALDPLTYLTLGGAALTKAGTVARKAGLLGDATKVAGAGKRVSRMKTSLRELATDQSRMDRLIAANKGRPIDDLLDQKLGGIFGVGLPGLGSYAVGKAGGRAEKIAAGMDAAGEAIRFGKYSPVRYAAPLFSKPVRNTQYKEGQKAAITLSEELDGQAIKARDRVYEELRNIENAGVLKGDDAVENSLDMLNYLENIEPPKPDHIKAIASTYDEMEQKALQDVRKKYGDLESNLLKGRKLEDLSQDELGKLENLYTQQQSAEKAAITPLKNRRHAEYQANGYNWMPQLNDKTRPLQQTLDSLKDAMGEVFDFEKRSGVAITELDDPVEYFARLRQVDQGPMRQARDRNTFAPTDAFTLGRDQSMRGMLEGTAQLQRMSIDTEFAGIANLKGWTPELRKEMRNRWREKYGLVQHSTMFDGDTWNRNTDRLFDKITKLDRTQAERGIPMFATNPAEVALRRLEAGYRAGTMARGVRSFLNNYAEPILEEADGFVPLSKLFGSPQASSINQGHKEAKAMMVGELGEVAETARKTIFDEKKAKLMPSMVEAQLDAMGVAKTGNFEQDGQRMLDEWFNQTGDRFNTVEEFLGDEWAAREMAKITDDDILARVRVPENVAKDASRVTQAFRSPEEFSKLVAAGDTFTNWFKTNVTATAPSFHVRNGLSGQVQNVVGGAVPVTDVVARANDSLNLLRGKTVKVAEEFVRGPNGQKLTGEAATEALRREVFVTGILDAPGAHNDLVAQTGGSVASQMPGVRPITDDFRAPQGTRWRDALNPMASAGVQGGTDRFLLARWGRGVGNVVEGTNRISAYIGLRRQGWSMEEAGKRVKELHVDYSNLTDVERKVVRRAIPFYSFTKGMASFVTKELAEKPGGALAQTIRATDEAKQVNATTPQYVAETTSIPLGQLPDGSDRYITGLGLMHEQPMSLVPTNLQDAGLSLLGQMNPLYKGPLEYATGQSFFQTTLDGGRPLKDVDPLLGRISSNVKGMVTGEEVREAARYPRLLEMIAANSPMSRYLSSFRQMTDSRKGPGAKAASFLLGPRFTDVSPAAQDAILREQTNFIMQELGARDFTRHYIPEWIKERMSPEQLKRAEEWEAMQTVLANRTKERKLAREAEAAKKK